MGPLVTLGPANYSGARPGGAGPKLSPPAARAHAQASQQDALAQSVVEACSWRDHTLQARPEMRHDVTALGRCDVGHP